MSKPYDNTSHTSGDMKPENPQNILGRSDYDFFDEEKDVVEKTIRVKRSSIPNKNERWKIFENAKIIFIVESSKISKKEKEYLRTLDGFNFLIAQFKTGIKSLNQLKIQLKKQLKGIKKNERL